MPTKFVSYCLENVIPLNYICIKQKNNNVPAQNALPLPERIMTLQSGSIANSLKQFLISLYNC